MHPHVSPAQNDTRKTSRTVIRFTCNALHVSLIVRIELTLLSLSKQISKIKGHYSQNFIQNKRMKFYIGSSNFVVRISCMKYTEKSNAATNII